MACSFGELPASANTRPYLLPSLQLAGAGADGYLGCRSTGTLDGALAGANVGMLLGGIGATAYNLLRPCFAAGTPIRTAEGSKPIVEVVAGDHVLSYDENAPYGPGFAEDGRGDLRPHRPRLGAMGTGSDSTLGR